jgi:radical SAM superfamily enzyme YgiQ (UPF0313 family)
MEKSKNRNLKTNSINIVFIVPPHIQLKEYISPSENRRHVIKPDGNTYGSLITDMPLGPLSISAYLKKHIAVKTSLIDFNVELNIAESFNYLTFYDYFEDYFITNSYYDSDIFALSSLFSPSYTSLLDIAKVLRKIYSNKIIMAGGNIPSTMYKQIYLDEDSIDLICYGEGELPMLEYLTADNQDEYLSQSTSWITKKKLSDNNFKPEHNFIWNLNEIPFLDYDLCGDKYDDNPTFLNSGDHQDSELHYHILTSRGCPFHCVFCASHKVHGRKMRYYSVDRVKNDLLCLKENFGAKTLIFQDDHFMGNPKRALEIVKFIGNELDTKFIFQNSLALYALKREFLEAIKQAGMDQLVLSVESGSDRVLNKVMKKPLKLSIVEKVVKDCRELGIYTFCNIVMGLPGETKKDIEDSRKFLKSINANWFGFYIANPLVGSEMFEVSLDHGYLKDNWIGSDYKDAVIETEDWTSDFILKKVYDLNLELNFIENSDYKLRDYQTALDGFERAINAKKDHALAYYMAARCHDKLGDIEKAKKYLTKSKKIFSNSVLWKNHMTNFNINPIDLSL